MPHKNARDDLTAEYVRSILDYDPETGVLTWKTDGYRRARRRAGEPAGWQQPSGRWLISINYRSYLGHRLIWLIMTGEWPPEEIDHADADQSNNRWKNLRLASSSQNLAHRGRQRNNTSGFKGVSFNKRTGRYVSYIFFNRKAEYLGYFKTAEEAYAAHCARAKELHGEFDGNNL